MAAKSPNGVLRTPNTINKFKTLANSNPGAQNPLLIYFSKILEDATLNAVESIELARPVLQQGKGALLQKWFDESKLECSEDLGDLVKQVKRTPNSEPRTPKPETRNPGIWRSRTTRRWRSRSKR